MGCDVFLIAGEPSGDVLGASLLRGLKEASPGISFEGIGGAQMQSEGLESLLPMEELCVMGLWEVIGHLPRLMRLIQAVVEEVEARQPKVLVTIDLPDFNFQVAKRLKKRGYFKGRIVHYVAPSVWAWRPGRAKKMAGFIDGVMCLFPFEPPYFTKVGMKAVFTGHPLVEIDRAKIDRERYRSERGIDPEEVCVGVFFGSRLSELNALAPIFVSAIEALAEQTPNMVVIVPTLPQIELEVSEVAASISVPKFIDVDVNRKWDAFAACDVAIAASGTVGLELSYLGVPHVVAYKAHPVTALMVRMLAKIKYVHLANILLDRPAVAEFLQGKCNVMAITKGVLRLLRYEQERTAQAAAFAEVQQKLSPEGGKPSQAAARFVLGLMK